MSYVAIVLAAGSGRRFGGNKLTASFKGEPLVAHAIRAACAAPVSRVIVVCPQELDIGDWPDKQPVEAVRLTSPDLSTSLKAGISSATGCDGAFIFLGDMPLIPHGLAVRLAAALGEHLAAIPQYLGRSGHPVLLSARAFALIDHLTGDQGAGKLLKPRKDVAFVDCPDEGVLIDIDQAEDIVRLEQSGGDRP